MKADDLWHKRMGHPSNEVMSIFAKTLGVSFSSNKSVCDVCFRAKQTKNPFPPVSSNKAKNLFDIIHSDIWGPYHEPSSYGAHYFLRIVDDASRGVWLYLMKDKGETGPLLRYFVVTVAMHSPKPSKWCAPTMGLNSNLAL